ncbi:MAG: hypothetical protein COU51_00840, partial [Parcubacteria group bacterium CG10_big_fil_rev_8_21_14_0_10_36_14]
FTIFQNMPVTFLAENNQGLMVKNGFASVSGLAFLVFFAGVIMVVIFIIRRVVNRRQKTKIGATWDCGTDLTSRMEITSTGFARSIVLIFKGILKPSIQHEIEYHDSESRYLPKQRTVILGVSDVYKTYFYQPLHTLVHILSLRTKKIQSGNINTYIFYIFITLLVVLFATL